MGSALAMDGAQGPVGPLRRETEMKKLSAPFYFMFSRSLSEKASNLLREKRVRKKGSGEKEI
jgi:hypothetical protein